VKLHLGCGNRLLDGYLNMDMGDFSTLAGGGRKFIKGDVLEIHRYFRADSAEEIRSEFLFEHLTMTQIREFLYRCHTVLAQHGRMVILVPDFRALVNHWFDKIEQEEDYGMLDVLYTKIFSNAADTFHKSAWSEKIGVYLLESEGLFTVIEVKKESKNEPVLIFTAIKNERA
jgi:predicted SAM-dependent methyltransferase